MDRVWLCNRESRPKLCRAPQSGGHDFCVRTFLGDTPRPRQTEARARVGARTRTVLDAIAAAEGAPSLDVSREEYVAWHAG